MKWSEVMHRSHLMLEHGFSKYIVISFIYFVVFVKFCELLPDDNSYFDRVTNSISFIIAFRVTIVLCISFILLQVGVAAILNYNYLSVFDLTIYLIYQFMTSITPIFSAFVFWRRLSSERLSFSISRYQLRAQADFSLLVCTIVGSIIPALINQEEFLSVFSNIISLPALGLFIYRTLEIFRVSSKLRPVEAIDYVIYNFSIFLSYLFMRGHIEEFILFSKQGAIDIYGFQGEINNRGRIFMSAGFMIFTVGIPMVVARGVIFGGLFVFGSQKR